MSKPLIIAVDFDGTIVEHAYPKLGAPVAGAIETLLKLQAAGHTLILWTYRHGMYLKAAVDYCREAGLEFYAHNANHPDELYIEGEMSRKVYADVYIDDRNLGAGGAVDWQLVRQVLLNEEPAKPGLPQLGPDGKLVWPEKQEDNPYAVRKRKGFWGKK